ncbi:MAG TPA: carboxypeptidase-like regulatory domain-containing protein, partial [Chitinophagaceae bacterium]|nr:carboxypeptidase-like regulatory domain-containing protein [Chitinophagaceae bacterium]
MKLPAIFFVLIFPLVSLAQLSIKGKVVNASTGAVIPGCSVFIANTSKGTTADGNGYFELSDIPPGKHDLIVSSVGYETSVFSFTDRQLPLQLKIELVVKIKELDNVNLEAYVEEGWDKWGKIFT